MRNLKIVIHLNTLTHGGTERVGSNLANRFASEGHEVCVATLWRGEDEFALDPGVTRVDVGLTESDEKKGKLSRMRKRVKNLRAFLKKEKPDIVIALGYHSDFRALKAAKGLGIPVLISIRTNPEIYYSGKVDQFLIKLLYPLASGCVYQTTGQREYFAPYLQDGTRVILNPVNEKFFGVTHPAEKEKAVVHHARLVDFKDQLMLCDAFAIVHERHPDYVLRIYGEYSFDGTKELLEKKIKDLSAENFIFLMGGDCRFEEVLPKGEVYAFSSDWEGMPNSLLEAMALGMPVVATDCPCGGPRTVIRDGENGLLVPIKDPQAMADALCRLIEDKELAARLGREAAKICDITSADVIYSQWKEYIEEIIEKRRH